jgi:hypothetical protein
MSSQDEAALPKAYQNVKAAREATKTVRTLGGSAVKFSSSVGNFKTINDNRTLRANHRHCYGKKANISASFTFENLTCNTCTSRGEHSVLRREVEGTDALDDSPVCFILSDQCFPPVLPAEGDGECCKILLIEDGTLLELIDAFLDLTKGFTVPAGSVVVLASASYLASVGTATYAAEYVAVRRRLVGVMGGGIELTHGLPILLSGTEDGALIRSLVDLEHWLGLTHNTRDISRARRTLFTHILGRDIFTEHADGGTGTPKATVRPGTDTPEAAVRAGTPEASVHHPMRFSLPTNLHGTEYDTFMSPGYVLPCSVPPCSQQAEREILEALITDLNENYMTSLATEFCTSREGQSGSCEDETDSINGTRIILVGASHASRLAGALKELGAEVADLSVPGWRVTADNVESCCELLKEELKDEWEGETIVLYQLFDNTSFYAIGSDGSATLPVRSRVDGKYHIKGALGMVDRDTFKQDFSNAVPLLRAGGLNKKILLSPLIRYAVSNCCDAADHCTNRGTGLNAVLASGLDNLETWLDDLTYLKRIRNFCVINPNNYFIPDTEGVTRQDTRSFKLYWKDGPVHMTGTGYNKLAQSIVDSLQEVTFKRAYSSSDSSTQKPSSTPRPAGGRGRGKFPVDWAARRQDWVNHSDTVVHRAHSETPRGGRGAMRGQRGRGAPRGPWRGGYRGRVSKKAFYKPY